MLNAFIRPVLLLLTLPLTVVTLGLFAVVVNAAMLKLASEVVRGFEVHGFWSAVGGTLLMSLFTFFINLLIGDSGRIETVQVRRVVRFDNHWSTRQRANRASSAGLGKVPDVPMSTGRARPRRELAAATTRDNDLPGCSPSASS